MEAQPALFAAGGVLIFFVALLLLSSTLGRDAEALNVKDLVQTAAQLGETAVQDKDASLALQHSTQALTYLAVARRQASDESIFRHTTVRAAELERALLDVQAAAVGRLGNRAPTLLNVAAGYLNL
jgi:nitrogen fixation/metabolism regulation signal transduction histidine kinase